MSNVSLVQQFGFKLTDNSKHCVWQTCFISSQEVSIFVAPKIHRYRVWFTCFS